MFLRWLLTFICVMLPMAAFAAPQDFPALSGRVVDEAHILDSASIADLTATLDQHERSTGDQIVVVTLRDLRGQAIEEYGYQLGRHWGIGQKGADNGALMIIAPNEHKTRIEVGYGLEGRLTDAASALIIQNTMIPHFKKGDYAGGARSGLRAMLDLLNGGSAAVPLRHPQQSTGIPPFFILILILAVFIFSLHNRGGVGTALLLGSMLGGSSGSGSGGSGFSGGDGSFGGGGSSGGW